MIQAKQELLQALQAVLAQMAPGAAVACAFESPKLAAHGDLAVTAAMALARSLKRNPRELAGTLVGLLRDQPAVQRWVQDIEIAGPGFVNLRLKPAARQAVVAEVLREGAGFGRKPARDRHHGQRVLVEFVSANPTGPLHVGHARQAALGDCICNLFEAQGWQVTREFYYNDAGVQIATLAASTQARLRGLAPGDDGWPEAAYNGDYIADIAAAYRERATVSADDREFTASGDVENLDDIRQFAVAYLRREQDLDLQAFGVRFDHYFLESSLYTSGRVEAAVKRLVEGGDTYEAGGALWLRSTTYGDDKDRVMRKSAPGGGGASVDAGGAGASVDAGGIGASVDSGGIGAPAGAGGYTYFVPDVAYHIHKFERGFAKVINVQGSDHHGTIARVRAGLQAVRLGIPPGFPDYLLHKMVTVMRGGQEVKISKRAGSYVTLRDLIDWTSRDAVRFFLISRKADTEFVFDIDLALKANDENPVFYVQYAHARICSVLAQWPQGLDGADLSLLTAATEQALMLKLAEYPEMLARAAAELAPHDLAFYLRDLSAAFHSWYAAERFLADDAALARARMALLTATRQVLRNALQLLGVSAPEAMAREAAALPEEAT
jgi:arginyl-tRNA synthetase